MSTIDPRTRWRSSRPSSRRDFARTLMREFIAYPFAWRRTVDVTTNYPSELQGLHPLRLFLVRDSALESFGRGRLPSWILCTDEELRQVSAVTMRALAASSDVASRGLPSWPAALLRPRR